MTHTPLSPFNRRGIRTGRQQGFTLIELMVGLAIGLLVVGVSLGALLTTHTSGTYSNETNNLNNQARQSLRIVANIVRTAGARELVDGGGQVYFDDGLTSLSPSQPNVIVTGTDGSGTLADSLTIATENRAGVIAGCSGIAVPSSTTTIRSILSVTGTTLMCEDNASGGARPMLDGVEDLQVKYLVRDAVLGTALVDGSAITAANWQNVIAIQLCLQVVGNDTSQTGVGNFTNCKSQSIANDGRVRLVLWNTFSIRNENL
jgi:type IV pilus assembly protein PilW